MQSIKFAESLDTLSKYYKLPTKFKPVDLSSVPFQDAAYLHSDKRGQLIEKLWPIVNHYSEDDLDLENFCVK